ncbi:MULTISPECIES: lantibiotic lacticin 3147 A2 [Lactococcus]|uniref:Lantibiotic lacticin 3147 A2 n=1 Tax=Lactococcus lactis subsp. lactis TaxID=1360 RepID=LANA2_LACLL|nr:MULTISPECIES: lantibiotic lacticin 3147 A2 [Lactococcus]O87237.1 RecName: Full=Lantibiotic lacticin 3147 A2; Flags: Precursor [Lactococcus lactis subsp. lactis]AAC56054.1 L. lactis predicted coding region ORF00036 [Lactococcus lactis]AAF32257.1 LtnB [Lactococcus lactis]MDR9868640.1 lantibiotic lacticin 3147 A2 [Lactococcus cremoris]
MKEKNMKKNDTIELQLGKYLEDDMIELAEGDESHGGTTPATPAISILSAYISTNTCPTTKCTRAC